jgi:hypothetical protein
MVDVSEYDRSPPGGGGAARLGDRVWERHSNAEFRHAIAQAERSAEHRNHGYRQYNDAGGGRGAFARYQLRMGVLIDAGWMDRLGRWTEKAASFGVTNDMDFLDRPEAQERAMTDALRVYDRQARALALDKYVGQEITVTDGSAVLITRAGIIAAEHREGVGALSDYLRRRITGKRAPDEQTRKQDLNVQKRLREFASIPYESYGQWNE